MAKILLLNSATFVNPRLPFQYKLVHLHTRFLHTTGQFWAFTWRFWSWIQPQAYLTGLRHLISSTCFPPKGPKATENREMLNYLHENDFPKRWGRVLPKSPWPSLQLTYHPIHQAHFGKGNFAAGLLNLWVHLRITWWCMMIEYGEGFSQN